MKTETKELKPTVTVRTYAEDRKSLKLEAVETDKNIADIIHEMILLYFKKK